MFILFTKCSLTQYVTRSPWRQFAAVIIGFLCVSDWFIIFVGYSWEIIFIFVAIILNCSICTIQFVLAINYWFHSETTYLFKATY